MQKTFIFSLRSQSSSISDLEFKIVSYMGWIRFLDLVFCYYEAPLHSKNVATEKSTVACKRPCNSIEVIAGFGKGDFWPLRDVLLALEELVH